MEHVVKALRASQTLMSKAKLAESVGPMLDFALPRIADTIKQELEDTGFTCPSKDTLLRANIRFDVTCMVYWRKRAQAFKGWRCIMYDASPKYGVEIFCVIEF